jgi:hypothetical protein
VQQLLERRRPEDGVEHLGVQLGEQVVARRRADRPVERPVERAQLLEVRRGLDPRRQLGELGALLGGRPGRRVLGQLDLDQPAGLEDLADAVPPHVVVEAHLREVLDDVGPVAAPLDETEGDDVAQRLAHRRARHAELLAEDVLAREHRARPQHAAADALLELPADVVGQRPAGDGCERHPRRGGLPKTSRTIGSKCTSGSVG